LNRSFKLLGFLNNFPQAGQFGDSSSKSPLGILAITGNFVFDFSLSVV
jgi:hypothetical protein